MLEGGESLGLSSPSVAEQAWERRTFQVRLFFLGASTHGRLRSACDGLITEGTSNLSEGKGELDRHEDVHRFAKTRTRLKPPLPGSFDRL